MSESRGAASVTLDTIIAKLPKRAAHAAHALLAAGSPYAAGIGPLTAAEVCVYDMPSEATSARHTGAALREAQRLGYAAHIPGGYWITTGLAHSHRDALEDRFMRDEEAS